jgi:hypothetical protein
VDVTAILRQAVAAVEESGVPREWRELAFAKAVDLLARDSGPAEGSGIGSGPLRVVPATPPETEVGGDQTILGKIATKLRLPLEVVNEVYHDDDGTPDIIVSPTRFPSQKSRATKEIALLVAAARQAAGLDDFTSVDAIRPVVESFRRYDPPNFSTAISEMQTEFNHRGAGRRKEVRVSRPGWEAAAALAGRLGGADN